MEMKFVLPSGVYENVELKFGSYTMNGGTAITLESPTEGRIAVATTNLAPQGFWPSDGCVFIKTWSENEGLLEELERNGVGLRTRRVVPAGFAVAQEFRLAPKYADKMEPIR
jgi:hypothetical protein